MNLLSYILCYFMLAYRVKAIIIIIIIIIVRRRRFQLCFQLQKYSMDFFRLKTLKSHTNARAVCDRPSLKDGERQFRPGSFHELQDNSNVTQTNSNEAKNASDNAEMMVHVDESFNFHTSKNSYVNF